MKFILTIFAFCLIAFAQAQYENSSFYFDKENLDTTEVLNEFNQKHLGYYDQESAQYKQMVLTKDSISVRFGSEIIIAKKDAIAKGYTFKDKKMYGVAPLNGVHYQEVNDTILALYYQYDNYFSISNGDKMFPMEKGYMLFIHEQGDYYSAEFVEVSGSKLIIHSLDHSLVMDKLNKITTVEKSIVEGNDEYIAKPTIKELSSLVKSKCFTDKREYVLNKEL
jgi:hypothetical protein